MKHSENSKILPNELDTEVTIEEILNTAKKKEEKKAAYSDRINNEMIKCSVDIFSNGFTKVLTP